MKATLAARIEATGVRGYSLEVVPAATPVPAGAKAIGNCEGGALKVLYRRWGGASAPASAVVAPEVPVKPQPPAARAEAPAPLASVPIPKPVPVPVPAPAPVLAKVEPVASAPIRASEVQPVAPSAAQSAQPAEAAEEKPSLRQRVVDLLALHWRWLIALLAVPLVALGWAWRAHHLAYDKNGLPRGPRL